MKYFWVLLIAAAAGLLCSCASRQAGDMISKAQGEVSAYAAAADAKVKEAEDKRLESEMKDMVRKATEQRSSPADVATQTQQLLVEHDQRLAEWFKNGSKLTNAAIELSGAANFHKNGVTTQDAIDALMPSVNKIIEIFATRKVVPVTATTPPIPVK